jgi:EAL domain-containing protein (putative c-di-GMP-specific phosphodiesterase class I)
MFTTRFLVHSIGIGWSIDDFGTGYSSLSYLHRLQADTVKVDRSFVGRIGNGESGAEMVCTIVALAQNLGMDVVAEGVETAEQLSRLGALGCEYVQGFYLSKPVDVAAADCLIASQPWRGCDEFTFGPLRERAEPVVRSAEPNHLSPKARGTASRA